MRRTTRNTNPAPSAAVSLSGQRPPASHRLPLPSDRVVTVEKGIRALLSLSLSSSLWATNFSNGACPGCHRGKTGNVEPDLLTAELRLRRLRWLQGGTSRPGAIGSVGARGTRPKPRPGSLRSLAASAHGRPSPSSPWLRDSQSLAPGLPLPAAGGAEERPP